MNIFTFKPLFKQTLWGGEQIVSFRHAETGLHHVGESWEISSIPGSETVVAFGKYSGLTLTELTELLGPELVGQRCFERFGNRFPLLIKFIDARQDLSIQVHPNDRVAQLHGHSVGKAEMWYMLKSAPGAHLRIGLKQDITPDDYRRLVDSDSICDVINNYEVNEGDCFYLPPGCIHSIGAGCFLLEIQQGSDVTYRIYDFKRRDKDGNLRQLHTELAAEAINYDANYNPVINYTPQQNGCAEIISCEFFHTSLCKVTGSLLLDYSNRDSFVVLVCTSGNGTIGNGEGESISISEGDTLLVAATERQLTAQGHMSLIETYI